MDFDAAAAEAYKNPFPNEVNVEAIMAKHIVMRAVFVAPMIIALAWMWNGSLGAYSAAIGVAVIVVNFLLSGWVMSRAATVSMQLYHAAALFGFFLRLGFITASMLIVANLFEVDRRALGVAAITAFMVLLVLESVATLRGARKELEWS
jgi:hypothetical protein